MAKCEDHPLDVPIREEKLGGVDGIKVHGVMLTISTVSTLTACALSFYLIWRHVTNYTQPKLQKLIIRILFMVPVYTIACLFSIPYYKKHVYIATIYEFYESLVIASFFLLLCRYVHPELHTLRKVFALVDPKPWIHPIRFFRVFVFRKTAHAADGLRWISIIWACVFQFCVVKFLGALVKCITEAADVYCKESNSAKHAKIWVMVIEILSLVTAMLCLLQFYSQTKVVLEPHRPLLKFVAIKLVVFLFYVQSFIFNMLTKEGGALKPTKYISYPSLAVGIPNTLLCVEMAAVSILHLYAYPWNVHQAKATRAVGSDDCDSRHIWNNLEGSESDEQATKLQPMAWGPAMKHVLSFKDVWRGIVQGIHGIHLMRGRLQKNLEVHMSPIGSSEHPALFKTKDLEEALAIVQRESYEREGMHDSRPCIN